MLYRFKHEFRELADLQHPNLLRLGELCCEHDQWYFTMELVRGKDFFQFVRIGDEDAAANADHPTLPNDRGPSGDGAAALRPAAACRGFDEAKLRAAAAQLASAVHALHRFGFVHRDIKPSNVLVRDNGHVVLLDFGLIERIGGASAGPDGLRLGTPHFMAPEQTLGQHVGPEADWYAVGVMLFLALTGKPPYVGAPELVLVAKRTLPVLAPSELVADVPHDLDELCYALLARTPGERPRGDEILRRLHADKVPSPRALNPASNDAPLAFVGRGAELAQLSEAWARVRAGQPQLVVIEGDAGVGKSSLVRYFLERQVARDSAAVILGGRCYEQESLPFKAFDAIIDSLSVHLASLPEAEVKQLWGGGIRSLSAVFPVLRDVPAVARSAPADRVVDNAMALRDLAFRELKQLLGALAERVPLIIFVDDLQWADKDSLALLHALFAPPGLGHGMFITTLRTPTSLGDGMASLPLRRIDLQGLTRTEAQSLWSILWTDPEDEVAAAPAPGDVGTLLDEAAGHPLLLSELVRYARRRGLAPHARLQDVLWSRVVELDEPARRFLELVALAGAPIGAQVIAQAAAVHAADRVHLVGALRAAQLIRVTRRGDERLVEPYHDRLREAIVRQLHADGGPAALSVRQLHLRLGRRLLEHTPDEQLPSAVFTIVQHLNAAASLLSADELRRLAELSLLAARQAKRATACATALTHLERGIALLGDDPWRSHYELCRALHWERLEATSLAGDRDRTLALFDDLLPRLASDEERVDLYATRVGLESAHAQWTAAIEAARRGLALCGERLPRHANAGAILREYTAVRWRQRRRPGELVALPSLSDRKKQGAMKVLIEMAPAAYCCSTELLTVCLLRIARLSLRYGITDASAYGLAGYGVVLSGAFGKHQEGYALGQLALGFDDRFPSHRFRAKVLFVNAGYLTPWLRPFAEARQLALAGVEAAQESGDAAYEVYCASAVASITMWEAAHLTTMQAAAEASLVVSSRSRSEDVVAIVSTYVRYCAVMRGPESAVARLPSDEDVCAAMSTHRTPVALFSHYYLSAELAYLAADDVRARALLQQAHRYRSAAFSTPAMVDLSMLQALVAARAHDSASVLARVRLRWQIARHVRKLARWARLCPENFAARHLIVAAEQARVLRPAEATPAYEAAIALAQRHRSYKWEAIALDLLARHHRQRGEAAEAAARLAQAIAAYRRWGADRRAAQLEVSLGASSPSSSAAATQAQRSCVREWPI
jgi:predicted ATPase